MPAIAQASNLKSDDFVGISFWLISMALVAASFLSWKHRELKQGGGPHFVVSGLVTLVAAVHYFYMRDVWVATGDTPTVYRYIDWLILITIADDRVLLDPACDYQCIRRHLLASDHWYIGHADRWLSGRSRFT